MDKKETTAAILLGLVIHTIHKKTNSNDLTVLNPFIESLDEALQDLGQSELPARLPPRPNRVTRESGYAFFKQLIITDRRKPATAFHTVLFQRIGAHPVIAETIAWLSAPGPPPPLTDAQGKQVNTLINTLHCALLPDIQEALEDFLNHHVKGTPGFEAIARAHTLVPEEKQGANAQENNQQVRQQRTRLAQQLVLPLLGVVVSGQTHPSAQRTLAVWAERGWVAPGEKLRSVLRQALLGPGMDGRLTARRRGAIVQGLVHWFCAEVLRLPFVIDAWLGCVRCPDSHVPKPLLFDVNAPGHLVCPQCGHAPVPLDTHRIVMHRHNIAGEVLPYDDLCMKRAAPGAEDGQSVWVCWELKKCPPEHWVYTLLGQAAVKEARTLPHGLTVLAALLGEDGTALHDLPSEDASALVAQVREGTTQTPAARRAQKDYTKYYKTIGRKLHTLCAGVQKRYTPLLSEQEEQWVEAKVRRIIVGRLPGRSVGTAMAIVAAFIKERVTLANEAHYFPRRAERTCPLVSDDQAHGVHEAHYGGVGQRLIPIYFRVDAGGEDKQPPGDPHREQEHNDALDIDIQAKHLGYLEQVYEKLQELYDKIQAKKNTKMTGALAMLGITEEAYTHHKALMTAWEHIHPLLTLYRDSCPDIEPFAQQAERQLWEMFKRWPKEPRPWRNQAEFNQAIFDLLGELLDIIDNKGE